jgi:peroxiredoxin
MAFLRRFARLLGASESMTNLAVGGIAPNFSLKSLAGQEYSLAAAMKRGPTVAAFFKVSCPVCQFTFPFLERIYKRYGGDGVTFLGISQDDARDTRRFADDYGCTFPMLLDEAGYPVSNGYGLTNVPTVFLIDTDATVRVVGSGFDKAALEAIAALLAENRRQVPAALFRPDEKVPDHKPG